jgi:RING-type zinc-finger
MSDLDSSAVAIITRPPEIIACLKLRLAFRNVFIIFDSHPRPPYPNGAGMIANTSIEGTARRLAEILPNVDFSDGILQWQAQLLSVYSGHVFVPQGVEKSTPTLWQTILEFSLAQLSMRAEISELRSQNVSLKNEQQRLESKIKEEEARSQPSPAQLSMQAEISKLRAEISELRSQNVSLKNGQQRLETEIKEVEARSRRQQTQTLFQQQQQQQFGSSSGPPKYFGPPSSPPWTGHTSRPSFPTASTSTLNPFSTSTPNPFNTSTPNPFSTAALNPFSPDFQSTTKSSSGRALGHSFSPPTPHSGREDDKFYAIRRLQHEYDNKDRALSDFPSAAKSSSGRAPGHPSRATRVPTPPSDRDDSILYVMRLQHEYDNEDRALSNFPSAAKSHSGRAPSHPDRASRALPPPPPPRPSDRDDSLLYAMRLQHEFDKEDRVLSAERAELSKFSQRLFECGVCMEEMPYDSVARPDPCGHTFCRDCLRGHVTARLDERKFPILCPTCTADKSKGKGVDGGTCRERMVNSLIIISHCVFLRGLAVPCPKPRTHRQAIQNLD